MQTTVQARVKYLAETNPQKEVFVFVSNSGQRTALTCHQLFELSCSFGSLLKKRGIKPGNVVCNTLPNSLEMVVCDFGILAAGGVILNKTAYLSDGSDLCYMLNTSKCKIIIADPNQTPNVWNILKMQIDDISEDDRITSEKLPFLESVILAPVTNGNDEFILRLQEEDSYLYTCGSPSDAGTIWMTSGTTGLPKLILTSHNSLLINARIWASIMNEKFNSILFNDTAMGHASSFAFSFLASCAKRVLIDRRFQLPLDLEKFIWEVVCSEECTAAFMSPLLFKAILRRTDVLERNNYLLDVMCVAGQPVRKEWSDLIGKMTRSVCLVYGFSEMGYCTSILCRTPSEMSDYIAGFPSAEGIKLKVVKDNLQETEAGEQGNLLVHSNWMFRGYTGYEEQNKSKFTEDGWFKTDDLAFRNNEGCLYVVCRKSDAIARGACTVYPSYYETVIGSLPTVAEVIAVPMPDKDLGNEICTCVIFNHEFIYNENEVAEICDSLFIKGSDIPEPRYYMVMKKFPELSSGKPDKKQLIKMAMEKFNLF